MTRRVMITGYSAISSAGITPESHWHSLINGISHLKPHPSLQETWPNRLGGFIELDAPEKLLPDRKLKKVISRQDIFGIYAAIEACRQSGLITFRDTLSHPEAFNERTGVYVGSPGNKYEQQYDFLSPLSKTKDIRGFSEELFNDVHPMWLLRILPNNVLAYVGITLGFKGPNHNITNHAASGAQAILEAFHAIQNDEIDRAVVAAYDLGPEPQAMLYYDALGLLSGTTLKPFDKNRDGTILAEGASAIILESEESAKERKAHYAAEILMGKTKTEGSSLFSIKPDGAPLTKLLQDLLKAAKLSPQALSGIVAHGNGNQISDESEAQAISNFLHGHHVPVTAFKWSMGHTLAASGLLDTVLSLEALKQRILPGIATLKTPLSEKDKLFLLHEPTPFSKDTDTILVVNRSFANINTALLLKSCESI